MPTDTRSDLTEASDSAEFRARAAGIPVLPLDILFDEEFKSAPYERCDEVRELGEIVYSSAARGFWVLAGHDVGKEAYQHPELFSNAEIWTIAHTELKTRLLPSQLEPPEHGLFRDVLNPLFSPSVVSQLEASMRATCRGLLDRIVESPGCEFVSEFANRFVARVFLDFMGIPVDHIDDIIETRLKITHPDSPTLEGRGELLRALDELLEGIFDDRRKAPRADLSTMLLDCRIEGRPFSADELRDLASALLGAGLGSTASELTFAIRHLALDATVRAEIVADPSLIPGAIEEFVRFNPAVIVNGRIVAKDMEFHGAPMRAGDRVVILVGAATRDPSGREHADMIDIHRRPNRHSGFGLGPHRCIGSHLARAELRIALEEWHRRIPDYHLTGGPPVHEVSISARITELPIAFDRVIRHREPEDIAR